MHKKKEQIPSKAPELLPKAKDIFVLHSFIFTGLTRQDRLILIKITVLMKSKGY
jgi:hypothetical protein